MDYDKLIDFLLEISNEAVDLGMKCPNRSNELGKDHENWLNEYNDHYRKIYDFAKEHGKIGDTND